MLSGRFFQRAEAPAPVPPPAPQHVPPQNMMPQGPSSWSSEWVPTPDVPPVFWPPMYNPLALLPREEEDANEAYHVGSGPPSTGYSSVTSRLRPMSPPVPRSFPAEEGTAESRAHAGAERERQPTPEAGAQAGPSVDAPKRRLEFLREEGAKNTLEALHQRIREDFGACHQFVAENDEQRRELSVLRREVEDLQKLLSQLSEKQTQTAAEAEEEEERMAEYRRLRSSLRKGLHDAQKRCDGANNRSRAARRQLQRQLARAATFLAVEEQVAAGIAAGPDTSFAAADDTISEVGGDRDASGEEAEVGGGGLMGKLVAMGRHLMRIRLTVSMSEVSLTLLPGESVRRRRSPTKGWKEIKAGLTADISDDPALSPRTADGSAPAVISPRQLRAQALAMLANGGAAALSPLSQDSMVAPAMRRSMGSEPLVSREGGAKARQHAGATSPKSTLRSEQGGMHAAVAAQQDKLVSWPLMAAVA